MREILFRGQSVETGKMVYGYFVQQGEDTYIFEQEQVDHGIDLGGYLDCCRMREVIPETVGQWTGLVDKNGNQVFEGDIVKYVPRKNCEIIYEVIWQQEYSRFALVQWSRKKWQLYEWGEREKVRYMCEVLGNIHDNPELLEESK